MAKLIPILILSFSLCSSYARESTVSGSASFKKTILIKDYHKGSTRTPLELIGLYQEDTKLEAFFYDDLGSTQITVYNGSGMCVYHTVIDAKAEEHTVIDLSLCPKGSYKITFTTDNSSYHGDFKL